jgi:hypothetical protein
VLPSKVHPARPHEAPPCPAISCHIPPYPVISSHILPDPARSRQIPPAHARGSRQLTRGVLLSLWLEPSQEFIFARDERTTVSRLARCMDDLGWCCSWNQTGGPPQLRARPGARLSWNVAQEGCDGRWGMGWIRARSTKHLCSISEPPPRALSTRSLSLWLDPEASAACHGSQDGFLRAHFGPASFGQVVCP